MAGLGDVVSSIVASGMTQFTAITGEFYGLLGIFVAAALVVVVVRVFLNR